MGNALFDPYVSCDVYPRELVPIPLCRGGKLTAGHVVAFDRLLRTATPSILVIPANAMADTLPLEVTNSLRLAHQALTEKGRKNAQEASPLEVFYERVWQIALPHKPFQKLQKPGVEAFYSGNMKKDEFVAFFRKNVFSEGHVQDAAALTELCFKTFLTVGSREQEVERCISWQAARQLWQVFAKLDRFGRLGLPNEEVNELLLRGASVLVQLASAAGSNGRLCGH